MRASQKSSALFSALFFLASSAAMAQAPVASETSWTDLTDDASRQKLFDEEIIPAKLKEEQEKPREQRLDNLSLQVAQLTQ